ncbi:MAG: hypothetical protein KDA37_03275, partial [Planctomycetales bacterium]|nr:hypothetical protein [Planctomycetales bacterium]
VSQFPNSAKAQELLADMLLDMGRYEELYQLLVRYESRFEIDLSDLANLPAYAPFLSSAYGRRWRQEHYLNYDDQVAPASVVYPTTDTPDAIVDTLRNEPAKAGPITVPPEGFEKWTDPTGQIELVARVVSVHAQEVRLMTVTGQVLFVPLEKLSDKSRSRAEALRK